MSGVRASFGGMLLLIAIHFHSNQMTAINDLVSSTLGMKVTMQYGRSLRDFFCGIGHKTVSSPVVGQEMMGDFPQLRPVI